MTNLLRGLLLLLLSLPACGPDAAEVAMQRGDVAFAQIDLPGALAAYEEAVALAPDRAEAYLGRGKVQWGLQEYALAIEDFTRALELRPGDPEALYFRGLSRMLQHDFEGSIADLNATLDAGTLPEDDRLRAHRYRGIARMNLERYEEAAEDYSAIITAQPNVPVNYLDRARLYEALGRTTEAVADYRAYLEKGGVGDSLAVQQRLGALRGS